jgi:hypothetical protein
VTVNGMLQKLIVANKLLYMYAQHMALGDAYTLFGGMRKRDPVSYSVMVGGFAKVGDYMNLFGIFRAIIRHFQPEKNKLITKHALVDRGHLCFTIKIRH